MTEHYRIGEYLFYPIENEIRHNEQTSYVRPKTAELLKALLDAQGQVVSKTELLDNVWRDVVVNDHVIFQSVTELRKIFGDTKVIKTHPRIGYSISEPVKLISANPTISASETKKPFVINKLFVFFTFVFLILLLMTFYYKEQNQDLDQGSVLVLPVQNHLIGSDYMWVRYGAMDLLIQYLQPNEQISVLHTEDVMDIIKRANIDAKGYDAASIAQLFEVSGASLIVEQAISGSTRDYQLVYSLHQRNATDRGALFSADIESGVFQLANTLKQVVGLETNEKLHSYESDFTNEMVASALDRMQVEDYEKTSALLQAAIATKETNFTAQRLLTQTLAYQGKHQQAIQVATRAIELAQREQDSESLVRLKFWQAFSLTQQKKFSEALRNLNLARQLATQHNDYLYLANISKITGKIYQAQAKLEQAKQQFENAVTYHQAIQCPFGHASSLLDLGHLAFVQNNRQEALRQFRSSLAISQERNLTLVEQAARRWINKLEE